MAEKKSGAGTGKPGGSAEGQAGSGGSTRKPWVKKTPVEHILEQIGKQEQKVAEMREELKKEERELAKLQQAKKLLEGT